VLHEMCHDGEVVEQLRERREGRRDVKRQLFRMAPVTKYKGPNRPATRPDDEG